MLSPLGFGEEDLGRMYFTISQLATLGERRGPSGKQS